ncbi:galactokinase family protein [Corynebacterium sp. A21]|uniref:galactokinase family protein n=1 Tax=Corynebacterium sp. A21 TaxID=3457318 RepID=UPI003FD50923
MPMWPTSEDPIQGRVTTAHTSWCGAEPLSGAVAPATWSVIGEHVDYVGGVVIMALSSLEVAVAISFRADELVRIRLHRSEGEVLSDETTLNTLADFAAEQQPGIDDRGRPTLPPHPAGGLASRIGGILWTMIHRQLLSRDTPGIDVTVISDIPTGAGLGALSSMDTAVALALHHTTGESDDAPVRARLAEVCSQSASTFSQFPPLRARHTAALRGATGTVSVIDYSDGSVTQAPHPVSRQTNAFAIFAPIGGITPGESMQIRERQRFLNRATHAFGVDSLRQLPDAPQRVSEWLEAVHNFHGPEGNPSLSDARAWLDFYDRETSRVQQLAIALRSRRQADVWPLLEASQSSLHRDYGLGGADMALAQLCQSRGAITARSAAAGISMAVITVVPAAHTPNFQADMIADGLMVVPLTDGDVTRNFS